MNICIFQFDIFWLNPKENLLFIRNQLQSISKAVDLIILPEMYLSGFCMDPTLSAVEEDGAEITALIKLAKEHNIGVIGSLAIKEGEKYFNRVLLLTEEGIVGRYDKQFLYSPSGENEVFDSRYESQLIEFRGWKILPQVCYDLRFPENVRPLSAPDLLIYMANWPTPRIHHWDTLLEARAIENQCYVIGCNRIGIDGNNWEYPGHSVVFKPDGSLLKWVENNDLNVMTLSLSEVDKYRTKYKFLGDKKV